MRISICHKKWIKRVALLFVIVATIIFIAAIIFLLHGNSIVTVASTIDNKYSSINCIVNNAHYPFFNEEGYLQGKIIVNATFDDEIRAISLTYAASYETTSLANKNATLNSMVLNQRIEQAIRTGALSPRFTQDENTIYMNIYTDKNELDNNTKRFFLINENPSTIDEYILNYKNQNFICKIK